MSDGVVSWFYNQDGNTKGPFKTNEIDALIRAGAVDAHTKMWSEQLAEWTPLYRTELRSLLGDAIVQPPPLAKDATPPRAPVRPPHENPAASPQRAAPSAPAAVYSQFNNQTVASVLRGLLWFAGFLSLIQAGVILKAGRAEAQLRITRQIENEFAPFAAVLLLATAVLFLWWKYRSTSNLFRLRGTQSITPGGAVYWYFVPVAWFWKPYEAMRNLNSGYGGGDETKMQAWWGLFWAVAAIAVFLAIAVPDPVRTIGQARVYAWGSIVMHAVEALSCWAAAELVKTISEAEVKSLAQG